MKKSVSRRELLKHSLAGFGALSLPISLTACGSDDEQTMMFSKVAFKHGVASGDPLQDRVILWTRISPEDESLYFAVVWEISTDPEFKHISHSGKVETSKAQDFIVKVDADHLRAGQAYFYRFKFGSVISPIGQTRTLAEDADTVKFAVCSCSNYPAGYFHVYKEIAKQAVDVVIHLGDYIYEYGMGGYATEDAVALDRALKEDNQQEIISLDDYRKRYALYREDADLQTLHATHPFIVIWDDHELSNNTWENGAENHQELSEGRFIERKLAALQAYFEWMPIRPMSEHDHLNIYRQFNFGKLVQLNMLDTRVLARHKQLEYADYMTATGLNAAAFQADLYDPSRTLMGHTQKAWLYEQLKNSPATWNVLGQQVLMAKMLIPAEILTVLGQITSGQAGPEVLMQVNQMLTALVDIKMRAQLQPDRVSAEELQRIKTVVPYNLDAWDGYWIEREELYAVAKQLNKKLVVLAGDTHNAWSATLRDQHQEVVGVELATCSVSSPGMEKYLNIPAAALTQFELAFTTLIDELNYCNLNQRGYLLVHFDAEQIHAEWQFITSVKDAEYAPDAARFYALDLDRTLQSIST